ncbi:hypothetical protein ANN_14418 [Periplaneta americana]|uniref:Uncharacterized protein n=1 Tax=Periplaneta americana TaxID=6978 RepID=A0ABQ8SWV7_PERAM|nr:hypothetical protein ANN_14418 [Periplaneta americana]
MQSVGFVVGAGRVETDSCEPRVRRPRFDPGLEHIKTLEKIQKRAVKCCRKNSPLKWDTLTDRRTRIRLCALSKTYRVKNYVVSVKCVVSVKKYVVSVKCAVYYKQRQIFPILVTTSYERMNYGRIDSGERSRLHPCCALKYSIMLTKCSENLAFMPYIQIFSTSNTIVTITRPTTDMVTFTTTVMYVLHRYNRYVRFLYYYSHVCSLSLQPSCMFPIATTVMYVLYSYNRHVSSLQLQPSCTQTVICSITTIIIVAMITTTIVIFITIIIATGTTFPIATTTTTTIVSTTITSIVSTTTTSIITIAKTIKSIRHNYQFLLRHHNHYTNAEFFCCDKSFCLRGIEDRNLLVIYCSTSPMTLCQRCDSLSITRLKKSADLELKNSSSQWKQRWGVVTKLSPAAALLPFTSLLHCSLTFDLTFPLISYFSVHLSAALTFHFTFTLSVTFLFTYPLFAYRPFTSPLSSSTLNLHYIPSLHNSPSTLLPCFCPSVTVLHLFPLLSSSIFLPLFVMVPMSKTCLLQWICNDIINVLLAARSHTRYFSFLYNGNIFVIVSRKMAAGANPVQVRQHGVCFVYIVTIIVNIISNFNYYYILPNSMDFINFLKLLSISSFLIRSYLVKPAVRRMKRISLVVSLLSSYFRRVMLRCHKLRFVIGMHYCQRVILVSVQTGASPSAREIKDSRMQLRRATSAVHKRAAKCTQADGDIF